MYILVKKFSLRHNNVVYAAGSVVELPADVAQKLYDDAPEDVEIISKTEAEKPASGKKNKKQPTSKSISKEPACDDEAELPAVDEAATVQ